MDQSESYKQILIIVEGHVQGVGFRYFIYDYANAHGLTGWVRNLYSGKVEILAEGTELELSDLLEQTRKGTSRSMVTNLHVEWRTAERRYQQFSLLPTE